MKQPDTEKVQEQEQLDMDGDPLETVQMTKIWQSQISSAFPNFFTGLNTAVLWTSSILHSCIFGMVSSATIIGFNIAFIFPRDIDIPVI